MSVQFGRWNIDTRPVDPGYLQKAKDMLAPYGPDGEGAYIKDGVGIVYQAFHTTKESRQQSQPYVTPSGSVLCWDGRLDNREELLADLGEPLAANATDVDIVSAAYEAKGNECLAKLIGDWALSIWHPNNQSLILAKDPIGTRHLYYSFDKGEVTWSTILDPLVLLARKTFTLQEEYIAGWLSFFPATHLTPYVGIHSVPPSCFVRLEPGRHAVKKYWDFDPYKRIRYRTDGEYEEHFRQMLEEAVRRRLRSDSPVLAELSGGMDSSSIVCMADTIIARGAAQTPRLDTVSYYDDSEPNWNESAYFMKVEEQRRRKGWHIDIGAQPRFAFDNRDTFFLASPGSCGHSNGPAREFALCVTSQGNRVLLSGVGGDEVTGGVPTPAPELADLLVTGQIQTLVRQLKLWALNKRKPLLHIFCEVGRGFLPSVLTRVTRPIPSAGWLNREFQRRNYAALVGYHSRLKLLSSLPSFQDFQNTLQALRRQLGCPDDWFDPPVEERYPYLDRDLLEFLCAIPVDQLLRPGQRRSLMRRSLAGIVPDALLNRKRKAYLARSPRAALAKTWAQLMDADHQLRCASLRIFNAGALCDAVGKARRGEEVPIVPLARSLSVECWLRSLDAQAGLMRYPTSGGRRHSAIDIWSSLGRVEERTEIQPDRVEC